MAIVRASLSLNSADVLTSALALTTVANLTCDSGSLIRAKVKGTATGADDLALYIANDTDSDGLVAKIAGGEFAFIPVAVDKKYVVYATKIDSMVEYGVFGNDNSSAPYGGS